MTIAESTRHADAMKTVGVADAPATSIVIIFLDAAPFLAEAIGSVRAQSRPDWELLLVDDGSTDGSSGIARAAAEADPARVRVLEHPGHRNRGTSASRELGLRAARGRTLLYLDADDVLFVDALAILQDALAARPGAAAALAGTLFWQWAPEFAGRPSAVQDLGRWLGPHAPPALLFAMTRNENAHPANCSSLFHTAALLAVGGFEAAFTGMYEDTVLLAKVMLAHEVVVLDACVSAYRMHPSSQCHRAQAAGTYDSYRPNADRARYLRWLAAYVRRGRPGALALRLAIRLELLRFDRPLPVRALASLRAAVRRTRPPAPMPAPTASNAAAIRPDVFAELARAQDAARAAAPS